MTTERPKRKDLEVNDSVSPDSPSKKQSKMIPSITKGVSVPSKPRVGPEFQAQLPPVQPKPAKKK